MVLRNYDDDLDGSERLWRYMDFDQFVHVLATGSLWLAPLSAMADRREGRWIRLDVPLFQDAFEQSYEFAASQTAVSSWVAADAESLPMWNSYTSPGTGVAVSADVHGLLEALAGMSIADDAFYLMRVEYSPGPVLIRMEAPTAFDPFACAKYKSADFEYEREVRVVYSRSPLNFTKVVGVPVPAAAGTGDYQLARPLPGFPAEYIPVVPGVGTEVWEMERVGSGSGTHHCGIHLGLNVDDESVPPAAGTSIKVNSVNALTKNGVHVSPRAHPWLLEAAKSAMDAFGGDPSLVRPSALTHLFHTQNEEPFSHNIKY